MRLECISVSAHHQRVVMCCAYQINNCSAISMAIRANAINHALDFLINGSLLQEQKKYGRNGSHARKLSVARVSMNSMMRRTILPSLDYMIEHTPCSSFGTSLWKNMYPCRGLGLFSSFRPMHKNNYQEKMPREVEYCKGLVKSNMIEEGPILTENIQPHSQHILQSFQSENDKGILRKTKTVHGNKGRVPWNKGRKHSEETLERIRHRTKEALKDPKVRKKMSECPRTLSDQTKVKIRTSLRKLWGERLQWKRSREKFFQSWAESIAQAAKIGGIDQQELEWDSYDKFKQEIAVLQIHEAAEKAKVKEMARVRAERAALIKAERMARLAQKRREREENAKVKGETTRKRNKKSKEEKEKLAEFQEIKLKERLLKIHKKKSTINQVSNQHNRPWEKLDLDLVKGEQLQKEISLADQIRFAKNRRAEQLLDKL